MGLIAVPVEPDALNAILRLCLRLTRTFKEAALFAELGGIKLLLALTQASSFSGFSSLASLLVRHVLEDEQTLRNTMEKIIRSSAANSSPTCKELHYMLRSLAPAACREPATFTSVAKDILRVDLSLLSKRGMEPEDDGRLLLKSLPGKSSASAPALKDVSKTVIRDLLDFLVQAEPDESADTEASDAATRHDDLSELPTTMASILSSGSVTSSRGPAVIRQVSNELIVNDKKDDSTKEAKETKEAEEKKKKRHLLPKSSVCRLLAEMVKSYGGCAKLITEHMYSAGISELVKEDCSALAFILDELLTSTSDKECATLVKMLVAALSSCNHAPEAQTSLVTEVKNALTRSLSMSECTMKHTKVQALACLISTMIEHCPASVAAAPSFKSGPNMNNIVRCMVKKGLITDLARVTHALDLSSPSMANTINAALKPLETLSRIVNQPQHVLTQAMSKPKSKPEESRASEAANVNTNTTNSEATRAQNDELVGIDNEATEHDVSTAAESNDPNSESQLHTVEEGDTEEFDEMMDQLLEGDGRLGRADSSQNMETDDTINDSQMMSHHEESFVENDEAGDDDSETDSSHSQESSANEEDEDLDENDDEEDGEEDEDDEDDDGGSEDNYGDEQDEYVEDSEDTFLRLPGTDRDVDNVMMSVVDDPFLDDRANNIPMWGEIAAGEASTDALAAGGAAAPSSVAPSHPLLMGRSEQVHGTASVRTGSRPLTRQRGFRYIQLNPGPRTHGSNGHGSSQILQQLLGPSNGRDIFQFTESTRVLVMDSGFAILDADEVNGFDGIGQANGSALSSIPNALVRWNEESRVLDGDSLHDCMTVCKPDILEVVEKHRDEEFAERREKKKKMLDAEEEDMKKEEEERKKKEPEMATTPAPEAAGHSTGSADEMDVVVSENAAVHTAVDSIASSGQGSISDTAQRLAEDLAQAISSRVTGLPVSTTTGPALTSTAPSQADLQLLSSTQGLLSSLQDLLPGPGQPGVPPTSLSTVLQSLSSTYAASGAASAPRLSQSSTGRPSVDITTSSSSESVTSPGDLPPRGPTFQFSTPPPVFPTLPVDTPSVTRDTPSDPEVRAVLQAIPSIPPPLCPLSPSPDHQDRPAQPEADGRDVSMTGTEQEVEVENVAVAAPAQPPPASGEPQEAAGTSGTSASTGPDYSAILGDLEIPEGVDPSFLAALPEDMRQEVIEEQRRLTRARQQPPAQPAAAAGTSSGAVQEVNPEFLAALPPNIQEEVLAQQRMEQLRQRQAASDPTEAVNAGEFFQTLPPSLRQSLLAEMEESQISALPADMAAEAQNLRQDRELRSRQMMHERFFHQVHAGPNLSSILRNTVSRFGSHYNLNTSQGRSLYRSIGGRGILGQQQSIPNSLVNPSNQKFRGRQLLDYEGLSCLLILLFIDDSKLNTNRLHRILRNLCYHAPTRDWVVKCLLSILEKANTHSTSEAVSSLLPAQVETPAASSSNTPTPAKMRKSLSGKASESKETRDRGVGQPSWLNISMDAALGFRANVFQVQRSGHQGKKSSAAGSATIAVHPQASPVVCRHTLEVLIYLARSFPIHFLPGSSSNSSNVTTAPGESTPGTSEKKSAKSAEFWETLLKLDKECWSSKKGKSVVRSHSSVSIKSEEDDAANSSLTFSAFGQLLGMLASPVIKRSSLLTDKLLRLLSLISLGQPSQDAIKKQDDSTKSVNTESPVLVDKVIKDDQIQLAVEVLTSKACSEEGLEDVTALLLNLSYGGTQTRESILHLLLAGARELGNVVRSHVSDLLKELSDLKTSGSLQHGTKEDDEENKNKGTLVDKFTKEAVVLTAPTKPKGGGELQLGSMIALTNKTSSQSFFLRVLKVIIQLREAALLAIKKAQKARKDAEAKKKDAESKQTEKIEGTKEDTNDEPIVAPSSADPPGAASAETEGMNTQAPATVSGSPMEVESPTTAPVLDSLESLSEQLDLSELWSTLSDCLKELADTPDHHAVLVLQPTVEAFFLVHAAVTTTEEKKKINQKETRKEQLAHIEEKEGVLDSERKEEPATSEDEMSADTKKFLAFAETHRTVLNQILRQSTTHLADGPFNVLVDHTRVLDFDIKRRYFRTELERLDEGIRREDLAVHVRRDTVFEESYRELYRRSAEEWKNRFYIVFEGEEGQDAGGLLREWYVIISREIFNPNYALFKTSSGDRVTYTINDFSHINSNHLCYFKFVGRVIAKAIYDNKLLECYFTRSFYKHILAKAVRYQV